MRNLLVASLGLAILGSERPADACTFCLGPVTSPSSGRSLPASAPGIVLGPTIRGGEDERTLVLENEARERVAGAMKESEGRDYFAPAAELAPGTYTIRYRNDCESDGPRPFYKETPIHVTPAAALPVRVGTLRVKSAARKSMKATTTSGSCVEPVLAGVVDLAYELDPRTQPYADVLQWETYVDGARWPGAEPHPESEELAQGRLRLFTPCDANGTKGRSRGLSAGAHAVELRAILVGSRAPIEPARLNVKVTCGADNGLVAEAGEVLGPQQPGPQGSDGCAMSRLARGRGSGTFFAAVCGIGLIGLVRRRKRAIEAAAQR